MENPAGPLHRIEPDPLQGFLAITRKPSFDVAKARELRASGLGASEIARMLGVGRDSVYRVLDSTVGAKQHN